MHEPQGPGTHVAQQGVAHGRGPLAALAPRSLAQEHDADALVEGDQRVAQLVEDQILGQHREARGPVRPRPGLPGDGPDLALLDRQAEAVAVAAGIPAAPALRDLAQPERPLAVEPVVGLLHAIQDHVARGEHVVEEVLPALGGELDGGPEPEPAVFARPSRPSERQLQAGFVPRPTGSYQAFQAQEVAGRVRAVVRVQQDGRAADRALQPGLDVPGAVGADDQLPQLGSL